MKTFRWQFYTSGLQYMLTQANYQNQDIYHSLFGRHQNLFCSYYFRGQMDDILQKNKTELNKGHKNIKCFSTLNFLIIWKLSQNSILFHTLIHGKSNLSRLSSITNLLHS